MNVHLTLKSSNKKTGPIPVSTTSEDTCPDICPFKGKGCYASSGPLLLHWRKVTTGEHSLLWKGFLEAITSLPEAQIWRHNQAGDLPGKNGKIDARLLGELVQSNRGRRGFTYTHKPVLRDLEGKASVQVKANRKAIAEANANGFTINLSGNNLSHADELADLGIAPVCTVLPSEVHENTVTPKGRKVVICPFETKKIQCTKCKLCTRADRSVIVGFPAHGTYKKQASEIAKS